MAETHAVSGELTQKPRHVHDCTRCTFLGVHEDYDLYFCLDSGTRPTVLARYGNEGHEYLSGLPQADHVPAMGEARRRAKDRGRL